MPRPSIPDRLGSYHCYRPMFDAQTNQPSFYLPMLYYLCHRSFLPSLHMYNSDSGLLTTPKEPISDHHTYCSTTLPPANQTSPCTKSCLPQLWQDKPHLALLVIQQILHRTRSAPNMTVTNTSCTSSRVLMPGLKVSGWTPVSAVVL